MSALLNGTPRHKRNGIEKLKKGVTIEQEVLLREGTIRKVFAKNCARKRHTSCFVVVDN
jgi:hypothetical protein